MQEIIDNIRKLFATYSRENIISLEKIPQSGSNRIYFRLSTDSRSFIVTYGINIQENRTFIYFSRHFFSRHCPVPEILVMFLFFPDLKSTGITTMYTLFLKKA